MTMTISLAAQVAQDPSLTEIKVLLDRAQLYTAGIVVGVGGCMSMITGLMRILGMREEARRRWHDIMWGTAMALSGPTCVFLLATLVKVFLPGGVDHV